MHYMRMAVLLASVFLCVHPIHAQEAPQTGDLTIIVGGFASDKGVARIALMNSKSACVNENKSFCFVRTRIVGRKVEVTLKGIPYGKYAISVDHDQNMNGVLDKNLMGIPKEAYGYSNGVWGKSCQTLYDKIRFDFNTPYAVQQITVK